ncbi:hypothetical protein C8A03DRAFT_35444, partial [Achaetomium macrosporum]
MSTPGAFPDTNDLNPLRVTRVTSPTKASPTKGPPPVATSSHARQMSKDIERTLTRRNLQRTRSEIDIAPGQKNPLPGAQSEPEMSEVRDHEAMPRPARPATRSGSRPASRLERDSHALQAEASAPEESDDIASQASPQTKDYYHFDTRADMNAKLPPKFAGNKETAGWLNGKIDYCVAELGQTISSSLHDMEGRNNDFARDVGLNFRNVDDQFNSIGTALKEASEATKASFARIDELIGRLDANIAKTSRDLNAFSKRVSADTEDLGKRLDHNHKKLEQYMVTSVGRLDNRIDALANFQRAQQMEQSPRAPPASDDLEGSPFNDDDQRDAIDRLHRLSGQPRQQTAFPISEGGVRLGAKENLGRHRPRHDNRPRGGQAPGDPDDSDHGSDDGGDRRPADNRGPPNPPPRTDRFREESHETGLSGGTTASQSGIKIKRDDIGTFVPDHKDRDESGMVQDGRNLVFTDVYSFIDRINTFVEDDPTGSAERQILHHLPTLFGGSAARWWTSEVDGTLRGELRTQGLNAVLDALTTRFAMSFPEAQRKFNKGRLLLKHLAEDDAALVNFVQRKLRYSRAMGVLNANNSNWYGVMHQIRGMMDLDLWPFLREPKKTDTLAKYMQKIETARTSMVLAARRRYPDLKKSSNDKSSGKAKDQPSSSKSSFSFKNKSYDKSQDRDRNRDRDRSDKPRTNGKFDKKREDDGKKDRAHIHVKHCGKTPISKGERRGRANLLNPDRRTCGFCETVFDSRNALFKHLKHCEDAKNGTVRRPQSLSATVDDALTDSCEPTDANFVTTEPRLPASAFHIKDAPVVENGTNDSPRAGYTYLRVKARAHPDSDDAEICLDPGANRSIIGQPFLDTLEHTVERRKGKIRGIGKSSTNKWATFTLYLPGFENGKPTMLKFTRSAWVVDSLPANLLMGAEFLDPYKANINYDAKIASLQAIGFDMPFETRNRGFPCVRKVKTTRAVTLLPQQEAFVPVDYRPLPTGRPLMFNSRHDAAFNAVVDAKTPKVVALKNPTKGMMKIPKRYPIGRIEESQDSGYSTCSLTTAFIAMTAATALTALASPVVAADVQPVALAVQSVSPSVSAEFDFDDRVQAIIDGAGSPAVAVTPRGEHSGRDSPTPLSDHVFNLTTSAQVPFFASTGADVKPVDGDDVPEVPERKPIVPE